MNWFQINNKDQVITPSMLLFPDRIKQNLDRIIEISGNPDRLWPHVKTHKIPEIIQLQLDRGITRFKCATIAEAEMVAEKSPTHILLSYPLVRSGIDRFLKLTEKYTDIQWALIIDSDIALEELAKKTGSRVGVFLDIDIGMHRTGIGSPDKAQELYSFINEAKNLIFAGLHAYDGHNHIADLGDRGREFEKSQNILKSFIDIIESNGGSIPEIIAGGSPTFALHANTSVSLSPGTTILWDAGYGSDYPDLKFVPAAILIARIVSKPDGNICLDLGHKAIASEMKHAPVAFPQLTDFEIITHSEEHMVISTSEADNWNIGDCLYAIPWHICPTMALHETALIVENSEIIDEWAMVARKRKITI